VVVVDEHMEEYQPKGTTKTKAKSSGKFIPVIFIPQKPHPNGFLIYLLVTYTHHPVYRTERIPFILDILPHVTTGDAAPVDAIKKMLAR
jgi:hypothetical protein